MTSTPSVPEDIVRLEAALDATEEDARSIVAGLSEEEGTWRAEPASWSIAQCLDHLATANRVYVRAMRPPAQNARAAGSLRRRPAAPGIIGRWFVRSLEPPVRPMFRGKAPGAIAPRPSPALHDALTAFLSSQDEVRAFLREYADIDLAGVTFPNPFIRGVRFSLATGLHVIPAHERRHLWQARNIRNAIPGAGLR